MPVLLAHEAAGQQAVAVPGNQLRPALGAREALQVEHVRLRARAHHELARGDGLAAARAGAGAPEQPYVVGLAEDHVGLDEARGPDVGQHGSTAGALEATVVPVAVQRVQEEPLHDLASAAGAHLDRRGAVVVAVVTTGTLSGAIVVIVVGIVIVVVAVVEMVMVRVRGRHGAGARLRGPERVVVAGAQHVAVAHRVRAPGVVVVMVVMVVVVRAVVRGRRMRRRKLRVGVVVRVHCGSGQLAGLGGGCRAQLGGV